MSAVLKNEGRSPSLRKRRFYARYMTWVERIGYAVVLLVIGAFVYAFTARVDDVIAADGVELAPAFAAVEAEGPTLVVRRLTEEGGEVARGAPLLEVIDGEDATLAYRRWAAAETLGDPALLARNLRPATRTILAERAGTFTSPLPPDVPGASFTPILFAEKAEVARVTDFNEVHLAASLAGDTAAGAKTGGAAGITNLVIPNPDGVTLRGVGDGGTSIASRTLLPPDLKAEIEAALKGQSVRVKNDALTVAKVSEVALEARVQTEPGQAAGASPLDLAGGTTLTGRIADGKAVASAQLVQLPEPLATQVRRRVGALAGRGITLPDGTPLRIVRADATGVFVKIKAEGLADIAPTMNATALKTTFDADVVIDAPSPALVRALRDAAKTGKPVTARVEMVTGTRPLAFLLLKRS